MLRGPLHRRPPATVVLRHVSPLGIKVDGAPTTIRGFPVLHGHSVRRVCPGRRHFAARCSPDGSGRGRHAVPRRRRHASGAGAAHGARAQAHRDAYAGGSADAAHTRGRGEGAAAADGAKHGPGAGGQRAGPNHSRPRRRYPGAHLHAGRLGPVPGDRVLARRRLGRRHHRHLRLLRASAYECGRRDRRLDRIPQGAGEPVPGGPRRCLRRLPVGAAERGLDRWRSHARGGGGRERRRRTGHGHGADGP